jgi:hypothetical protein
MKLGTNLFIAGLILLHVTLFSSPGGDVMSSNGLAGAVDKVETLILLH